MLTIHKVDQAINHFPARYETREGEIVVGQNVSSLLENMREMGWRNVSRLEVRDFRDIGIRVVQGQYIGGARKTGRWVPVIVRSQVTR